MRSSILRKETAAGPGFLQPSLVSCLASLHFDAAIAIVQWKILQLCLAVLTSTAIDLQSTLVQSVFWTVKQDEGGHTSLWSFSQRFFSRWKSCMMVSSCKKLASVVRRLSCAPVPNLPK